MKTLPAVLLTLLSGSLYAAKPVVSPFATLEAGFESNVFQSPDTFAGTTEPVKDDTFLRYEAGVDLAWRFPAGGASTCPWPTRKSVFPPTTS